MKVLKKAYDKHYYAIWIFAFLMLYNFIVTSEMQPWKTGSLGHAFHLVDFSLGFCTKFLAGAVYNFFFDDTSVEAVSAYVFVVVTLIFFLGALILERLVLNTREKDRSTLILLLFFFLSGPSAISMFVYQFGMIDTYWLLFTIAFVFCLSTKKLYIFLPVLMLLSVLLHYAAIVAYIPLFVLLMLYKTTVIENKKERIFLWTVLITGTVLSLVSTIYFMAFEQGNLTYSLEEFVEILEERGMEKGLYYYPSSMYNYGAEDVLGQGLVEELKKPDFSVATAFIYFFYRTIYTLKVFPFEKGFSCIISILPVVLLIFSCFKKEIKSKEVNIIKRFTYFSACILFFFTIFSSMLTSTDPTRWTGEAYLILFIFFFYVMYYERNRDLEFISSKLSKIPRLLLAAYIIIYAFTIINPYC